MGADAGDYQGIASIQAELPSATKASDGNMAEKMMERAEDLLDEYPAETNESDASQRLEAATSSVSTESSVHERTGVDTESDDGDLEDYLHNMLNRYGVSSSSVGAEKSQPASEKAETSAETPDDPPETSDKRKADELQSVTRTREYQPARPADSRDDLRALREVANSSTHEALRTYDNRRLVLWSYSKFGFATAATIASTVLASMSTKALSLSFFVSLAAMIGASFWIYQYFASVRRLQKEAP